MKSKLFIFSLIAFSCSQPKSEKGTLDYVDMMTTINPGASVSYERKEQYHRNDIVAFLLPRKQTLKCLRLVGMPGDKIEIRNWRLFVNDKPFQLPATSVSIYTVFKKDHNFSALRKFDFRPTSYDEYGLVKATQAEYEEIHRNHLADSIFLQSYPDNHIDINVVKTANQKHANASDFGPISIPKVGDIILAQDKELVQGFSPFTDNEFTVQQDYYFLVGDSFLDAIDSRYFGLVPKDKLLGVITHFEHVAVIHANIQ